MRFQIYQTPNQLIVAGLSEYCDFCEILHFDEKLQAIPLFTIKERLKIVRFQPNPHPKSLPLVVIVSTSSVFYLVQIDPAVILTQSLDFFMSSITILYLDWFSSQQLAMLLQRHEGPHLLCLFDLPLRLISSVSLTLTHEVIDFLYSFYTETFYLLSDSYLIKVIKGK